MPVVALSRMALTNYTEQDVKELARILTGWTFGDGNRSRSQRPRRGLQGADEAVARYHDAGAKTFLGRSFPAGQTARRISIRRWTCCSTARAFHFVAASSFNEQT
jgi:uncharacterized protein (DUF1800 family)